ncbi:hypothetical protein FF098_004030 [Parvularcula flava]|uniref:Uncharacterized protein n=1 Tax=Aquisalinus luteolus TaxID=1566827 RepID=A0A8J3A0Y7_9PROT|nr:DUF6768 family protein [Aquisalinus luteolus]NHK27072.1 hypothetical protein [Aquisalinus luteolus]GGH94281.1 hypothetical protein GCM10011355_08100 [Aquisalinus luteolus]
MSDFDDKLREGLSGPLSADDRAFLEKLDSEKGMFESIGFSFQGKLKVWAMLATALTFVMSALGLWAVWQMFQADTTRGLILWAAAGWAAWTMQIGLKQWLWDRIRMLNILRELKKIELRLARLEERG